jgi:SAM-dependent methyltransferase
VGIDLHTFRLLQRLADEAPLGAALTIGRQSVDFAVPGGFTPPADPAEAQYCEWVLLGLGASEAHSLDISNYEDATHIGDLGEPMSLPRSYDTIIDAGSLEHVFDVATAFRNLIKFTATGGRIVHVLPVNNLSGHGFWQFSSDLIYALYSEANGFSDTRVWYASSINQDEWREIPPPGPGTRTELVSLEPVILLSVATKQREVKSLRVVQPFYDQAWSEGSEVLVSHAPSRFEWLRRLLPRRSWAHRLARNAFTVAGLGLGTSRYALRGKRFTRHSPGSPGSKQP